MPGTPQVLRGHLSSTSGFEVTLKIRSSPWFELPNASHIGAWYQEKSESKMN